MRNLSTLTIRWTLCAVMAATLQTATFGQNADKEPIRVSPTRMGTYHALADLIYRAFQNKDYATAATLARILERTWDKGESSRCSDGLVQTDFIAREEIDLEMDRFIGPIKKPDAAKAEPTAVKKAYETYIERLQIADKPTSVDVD